MSQRYGAFGTVLQRGDGGSPENFAAIAGVVNIGGPEISLDFADATAMDSPGAWEEVVATIKRTGQVTFGVRWDPGDTPQNILRQDLDQRRKGNWRIVWPDIDGTPWEFEAYVARTSPVADFDGVLGMDVALRLTGQPNFAAGS